MKKFLSLILSVITLLCLGLFAACGGKTDEEKAQEQLQSILGASMDERGYICGRKVDHALGLGQPSGTYTLLSLTISNEGEMTITFEESWCDTTVKVSSFKEKTKLGNYRFWLETTDGGRQRFVYLDLDEDTFFLH